MTRLIFASSVATLALAVAGCAMDGMDNDMASSSASTTASTSADSDMGARASTDTSAQADYPTVGGALMYPNRTIVQNASASADHTTLVIAVKAAGLADTLSGPGPFTVFAPTNQAFTLLPAGVLDTLMRPENQARLASILTYHVVPGRLTAAEIKSQIKASGGTATLTTVNGTALRASIENGRVVLLGNNNSRAYVTQGDVMQSNGVVHVVNGVLIPGT